MVYRVSLVSRMDIINHAKNGALSARVGPDEQVNPFIEVQVNLARDRWDKGNSHILNVHDSPFQLGDSALVQT